MQKVFFHYADRKLLIQGKKNIKEAVINLFRIENVRLGRIDYIFCSDDYLLNINHEFLQHDYYTDIITFDLSESDEIKADVYISLDRVRENALVNKEVFRNELLRVVFHGALHLCGYKDKKKKDVAIMREKEMFHMKQMV